MLGLDRLTKHLVEAAIPVGGEVRAVDHLLWIQNTENPCAAFSTCVASNGVFLAVALIVAVGIIAYEFTHESPLWMHAILGLILGGALGNGYDRLFHGTVTDFIALHWWPTFNLADSAIVVGVALLVGSYVLRRPAAT